MSTIVTAIGVGPVQTNIDFFPELEKTYQFHVDNDEPINVKLEVKGELEPYISLEETSFLLEGTKNLSFKISLPKELAPGSYNSRIEITIRSINQEMINVMATIAHKVLLNVPAHGKYIQEIIGLEGKTVSVWIKNIGLKEIQTLEITNHIQGKGYDQTFIETKNNLKPEEIFNATIKKEMNFGQYKINTFIRYDEVTKNITRDFTVGAIEITINNPYFEDFKPGEINKLIIPLRNNWNEELENMYLTLEITKEEVVILNEKSIDFAMNESKNVEMFWDLTSFEEGNYAFHIQVFKEEEIITEKNIELLINKKGIKEKIIKNIVVELTIIIFLVALSLIMYTRKKARKDVEK